MGQNVTLNCPEAAGCLAAVRRSIPNHDFYDFFPPFHQNQSILNKRRRIPPMLLCREAGIESCLWACPDWFRLSVLAPCSGRTGLLPGVCPSRLHHTFAGWLVCRPFGPLMFLGDVCCCLQTRALLLFTCTLCPLTDLQAIRGILKLD